MTREVKRSGNGRNHPQFILAQAQGNPSVTWSTQTLNQSHPDGTTTPTSTSDLSIQSLLANSSIRDSIADAPLVEVLIGRVIKIDARTGEIIEIPPGFDHAHLGQSSIFKLTPDHLVALIAPPYSEASRAEPRPSGFCLSAGANHHSDRNVNHRSNTVLSIRQTSQHPPHLNDVMLMDDDIDLNWNNTSSNHIRGARGRSTPTVLSTREGRRSRNLPRGGVQSRRNARGRHGFLGSTEDELDFGGSRKYSFSDYNSSQSSNASFPESTRPRVNRNRSLVSLRTSTVGRGVPQESDDLVNILAVRPAREAFKIEVHHNDTDNFEPRRSKYTRGRSDTRLQSAEHLIRVLSGGNAPTPRTETPAPSSGRMRSMVSIGGTSRDTPVRRVTRNGGSTMSVSAQPSGVPSDPFMPRMSSVALNQSAQMNRNNPLQQIMSSAGTTMTPDITMSSNRSKPSMRVETTTIEKDIKDQKKERKSTPKPKTPTKRSVPSPQTMKQNAKESTSSLQNNPTTQMSTNRIPSRPELPTAQSFHPSVDEAPRHSYLSSNPSDNPNTVITRKTASSTEVSSHANGGGFPYSLGQIVSPSQLSQQPNQSTSVVPSMSVSTSMSPHHDSRRSMPPNYSMARGFPPNHNSLHVAATPNYGQYRGPVLQESYLSAIHPNQDRSSSHTPFGWPPVAHPTTPGRFHAL